MAVGLFLMNELSQTPIADSWERKKPLESHTKEIIADLLEFELPDGRSLFTNKAPVDNLHYTKAIMYFQEKLVSIFDGRFVKYFSLSDYFIQRNRQVISAGKNRILKLKGDWKKIHHALHIAARNYTTWFLPNREPENKELLPRDFNKWLYNEHNEASFFLLCLAGEAFPIRETDAKRLFDSIPESYRRIANRLYSEDMDGKSFWLRIKTVLRWYDNYASQFIKEEVNFHYWLDSKEKWFENYISFILKLTEDNHPYMNNIGTGNSTWRAWLLESRKEYDIKTHMPEK